MRFTTPILLILLFTLSTCTRKFVPYVEPTPILSTAEVKFLSTKDGVLNLQSTGYCPLKDAQKQCVDSAQVNAFRILFYYGVPGSSQSIPLISYNEKAAAINNDYLNSFFIDGTYKRFIVNSVLTSEISEVQYYKTIVTLGINITSLRRELENHKVIRKFGLE
jgi:hypothetical protein